MENLINDLNTKTTKIGFLNVEEDVEEEKETPAESLSEKKTDDKEEPSHQGDDDTKDKVSDNTDDEDKLPFHKHPRFKELIQQNRELREFKERAEKDLETLKQTNKIVQEDEPMSKEFIELLGGNQEVWNIWKKMEEKNLEIAEKRVIEKLEKRQTEIKEAQERTDNEVKNEMQKLKDDGKVFDEDELKNVLRKYQPVKIDKNGEPVLNFEKGFEILEIINKKDPSKIEARKKVADLSNSKTKADDTEPKTYSFGDFGGKYKI